MRALLSRIFGFHARGDRVTFSEAEVIDGNVQLTIELESINGRLTLALTPETAWLVGNRLVDASHEASADRAGDTP
jgi:hypothetical protein